MCILLCRIKTMNFNLVVFISTAWCLQSFHKSTKIMWSTGGNQEKKSAVKWNWIWVVNSLFSLQHSSKLFLMMNYLAGRKSVCGWRSSPCLCLTPVFVCCHQSWDCSSVLEDARELHTQRIHCGSLLSASANFLGCNLRPDLEVCVNQGWEQLSNKTRSQVGAAWVWIFLQPHSWVTPVPQSPAQIAVLLPVLLFKKSFLKLF